MAKRVSIQGYEGSFHQIAVEEYLGAGTEVVCCPSFREVARLAADAGETSEPAEGSASTPAEGSASAKDGTV